MSIPSTTALPEVGGIIPVRMPMVVVLPVELGGVGEKGGGRGRGGSPIVIPLLLLLLLRQLFLLLLLLLAVKAR